MCYYIVALQQFQQELFIYRQVTGPACSYPGVLDTYGARRYYFNYFGCIYVVMVLAAEIPGVASLAALGVLGQRIPCPSNETSSGCGVYSG